MDFALIVLVGISLAVDCFAVSLAAAAASPTQRVTLALVLGTAFGLFQAGMMLLGWLAGSALVEQISGIDHWLAFVILLIIGGKMIYEGVTGGEERERRDCLLLPTLVLLAVATSIDSLGVGLTLAFVTQDILIFASVAGIMAFLFACAGAMRGGILATKYGKGFEVLGVSILIGIGLRILLEHLAVI